MKRENYISWDEYFMGVAMLSAKRSKDPSTQVGCCIVSSDKKIIGIGYNGFPKNISDDDLPWGREGNFEDTKYPYVVHAEANAILNSTKALEGSTAYVTLFPCNECAKLIVQSGIKEILYLDDIHHDSKETVASRKILDMAGVKYRRIPKKVITLE